MADNFYAPDGTPWCTYDYRSVWCINGSQCKNPHHRKPPTEAPCTPR